MKRPRQRPLTPLVVVLALLSSLAVSGRLGAGTPCFPEVAIPHWHAANIGGFPNGSSELQGTVYKLCSESSGFGPAADMVRYLYAGETSEFYFTVRVDDLDAPGIAGLMVRGDPSRPDSAFIAIYLQVPPGGGPPTIHSSVRLETGAPASIDVGPAIGTGLPVYFQISKWGAVLTTQYSPDGISFVNHLQVEAPSNDLASSVTMGMVQSSLNALGTCTGYFEDPVLVLPDEPPGRMPGDCNGDDVLDISDAFCVFGTLFLGTPSRFPCGEGLPDEAGNVTLLDWQPDGVVDVSDGIGLLQFLFAGGPPHPLRRCDGTCSFPFPRCAPIEGCSPTCAR